MQIRDTLIGYARVSTDDQDLRLQKAALLEPMLLQEHDRPSLRKVLCIPSFRFGDVLT